MTDDESNITNKLILRTLQDIQKRLAEMDNRLTHGVQRVSSQISALDSHMAGFYRSDRCQNDEIDDLRGRIEALEQMARDANTNEPKP